MTVRVRHGKFRIALWFPNGCLTFAINRMLKHARAVNTVDKSEVRKFVKALKKAKKYHKKIELVSVVSADGTRVKVTV